MGASFGDGQKPYAIVFSLDGMNGIQTARVLASRKIPVIGIARDPEDFRCRTRVCERILFAGKEDGAVIETLEALGPKLSRKAVLFPCSDSNVLPVSRHRQRLEEWYHIVLPESDVLEMMRDKVSFYRYAQKEGFPIPRTLLLENRSDAERAARELVYPSILKPPTRTPEWNEHSKYKVYKVAGQEELLRLYDRYRDLAPLLIAQEWIEGPDANLYSCNCYFNAASEPIVTFVARKLRQWPPYTGVTSLGEECRSDVVLQETVRLFKSVGYRGLGYLEMKQDARTGKYYIIEANIGRPTGRSAIAEAGGVELLYTMYCDALGWPLPENREQTYTGVKWVYLRKDLQSALHYGRQGELTLREWWRSWRGPKTYGLFSWTDPVPFFGDLWRMTRIFLSPRERRERGYRNPEA